VWKKLGKRRRLALRGGDTSSLAVGRTAEECSRGSKRRRRRPGDLVGELAETTSRVQLAAAGGGKKKWGDPDLILASMKLLMDCLKGLREEKLIQLSSTSM